MTKKPQGLHKFTRDLFYRCAGVPLTNLYEPFEEMFRDLNQSLYEESPLIGEIMRDLSDEETINQTGEGPTVVIRDGDKITPRVGAIVMLKYFYAKRIELIQQSAGDISKKTFLDVGGTNDILFRHLNKTGVGLNINQNAVDNMARQGIEGVLGDAEHLKYDDNSFDFILTYETLEHLDNPIQSLREMARVARERIYLTIPHMLHTRVCEWQPYDRGKHHWHFLEFSPRDFERVLKRIDIEVLDHQIIRPYGTPQTLQHKLLARRFRWHPWFLGFAHYELKPC